MPEHTFTSWMHTVSMLINPHRLDLPGLELNVMEVWVLPNRWYDLLHELRTYFDEKDIEHVEESSSYKLGRIPAHINVKYGFLKFRFFIKPERIEFKGDF
jgi:hypothetical protein